MVPLPGEAAPVSAGMDNVEGITIERNALCAGAWEKRAGGCRMSYDFWRTTVLDKAGGKAGPSTISPLTFEVERDISLPVIFSIQ